MPRLRLVSFLSGNAYCFISSTPRSKAVRLSAIFSAGRDRERAASKSSRSTGRSPKESGDSLRSFWEKTCYVTQIIQASAPQP